MKILRIIARLNVGGPARHVVWLTSKLQDEEFQSELIAGTVPLGEEDMSYFAEENGVTPKYVAELSRELSPKDVVSFWKIYSSIRRFQPDIVHTHTAKAGTVGRAAAFAYRWLTWRTLIGRPRRVGVVHTFHGHVFHSYYGRMKTGVFILVEKVLARAATHRIVTISDQQFSEIHERFRIGSREQFRIIPLGIDLTAYEQNGRRSGDFRTEIGLVGGEILVGFVGRLTQIKNLSLLIRAAASAVSDEAAPPMRFVIIGDGDQREVLEQEAAELGVADSVIFVGNRPDVADLLPELDIVVLTSRNEGTPLSLIEGMACGIPFVATAVGGVVDLAGDVIEKHADFQVCERGVLAEPDSPRSVANGLIYLAKNEKLRERIAKNGKQFAAAKYSTERLVDDIKALYRELAGDSKLTVSR